MSPAWSAVMVQVPMLSSVMFTPVTGAGGVVGVVTAATVHTLGVVLATLSICAGLVLALLELTGAVKALGGLLAVIGGV